MGIVADGQLKVMKAKAQAVKTGEPPAQAARRARADNQYTELKRALEVARDQVKSQAGNSWLTVSIGTLVGIPEYDENRTRTLAELDKLEARIEQWNTTERAWAWAGKDSAGFPYAWEEWERVGKVLGEGIQSQVQVAVDYSLFNNQVASVQEWVQDTVQDAGEVLEEAVKKGKEAFSWAMPVLIGVGVLGGLALVGYVVRSFR